MPPRVPVRPTKRTLTGLGLGFPSLSTRLADLAELIVQHAQQVPEQVAAGGAKRIRDLSDHVWFKVKSSDRRGAAGRVDVPDTRLSDGELPVTGWWLVAAGPRQDDSPQRDFYAALVRSCEQAGKGTGAPSTTHLLPVDIDYRRWIAEHATAQVEAVQRIVRGAIARSAQRGGLIVAAAQGYRIGALVRSRDGETYLTITAEGFVEPEMLAVILAAVPGVPADDWLPEAGPIDGLDPEVGRLLFSMMLPPEALSYVLEDVNDTFL